MNDLSVDPRVEVVVASVTPILKEPFSALTVYNFATYISDQFLLMLTGEEESRNYSVEEARRLYNLIKSKRSHLISSKSGISYRLNGPPWHRNGSLVPEVMQR